MVPMVLHDSLTPAEIFVKRALVRRGLTQLVYAPRSGRWAKQCSTGSVHSLNAAVALAAVPAHDRTQRRIAAR